MRPPKFNFIPERQFVETSKPENPFFTASIYTNGQLVFNSDYISVYDLNNKFIRFYADREKRTIGWKIIEGATGTEELVDSRQVKVSDNGSVKVSLTAMLHILGWQKGDSYKTLPIKTYKNDGVIIDYVELPDLEVHATLNGIEQ